MTKKQRQKELAKRRRGGKPLPQASPGKRVIDELREWDERSRRRRERIEAWERRELAKEPRPGETKTQQLARVKAMAKEKLAESDARAAKREAQKDGRKHSAWVRKKFEPDTHRPPHFQGHSRRR